MKKILSSVWLVGSFVALSSGASAQVVVEMSSNIEGAANRMLVKDEMVRVDSRMQNNDMSSIFRDDEMVIVNHNDRSYTRLGREQVIELGEKMNEARRQMEEQMANMPAAQRAMMERMMRGRMPGLGEAPEPMRVEEIGSSQEGEYACTEYAVFRGDEKHFEICAADVDDMGPGAEEAMAAFERMAEFTQQLIEAFSQGPLAGMIETPFQAMSEIEGFPVRTRDFDDGQVDNVMRLVSITEQAIDDQEFVPPTEYEEEELPSIDR